MGFSFLKKDKFFTDKTGRKGINDIRTDETSAKIDADGQKAIFGGNKNNIKKDPFNNGISLVVPS